MTRPIAILLLLLGLIAGAAATAPDEPLPVDEAFAMEASKSGGDVTFRWRIADGYYLYRGHFRVAVDGGTSPST